MSRDHDGSTGYSKLGSGIITAAPLTMMCWARTDVVAGGNALMCLGSDSTGAGDNQGFQLIHRGTGPLGFFCRNTSTQVAESASDPGASVWFHACGRETSTTDRDCALNGVFGTANTTSCVPDTVDVTLIGAQELTGVAGIVTFHNGHIAWPTFWDVALNDEEVAAAAAGVPHWRIRPESIIRCAPWWGNDSPELDFTGNTWTITGTAPKGTQEPPSNRWWNPRHATAPLIETAAGGTILPQMMQHGLYAGSLT